MTTKPAVTRFGALLVVSLTLTGCCRCPTPSAGPRSDPRTQSEVSDWLWDNPCDERPDAPDSVTAALTGGDSFENEVHDCQRLIRAEDLNRFGPLVGVFPIDTAMAMGDSDFGSPVLVATLYNWGSFSRDDLGYEPLNIETGWNCLYLVDDRGSPTRWRGFVIPTDSSCVHGVSAPSDTVYLPVVRQPIPSGPPPTARWGWNGKFHHIGAPCGLAWCEVGPPGFSPRPFTAPQGFSSIPGWHDGQHLAVPSEGEDPVVPGPWGEVHPVPGLANLDASDMYGGARVAYVRVQRGPTGGAAFDHYVQKLHLQVDGNEAEGMIRWGAGGPEYSFTDGSNDVPAPGYQRVSDVTHAALGAARWRWHDDDETIWFSCYAGCCHVNGFL